MDRELEEADKRLIFLVNTMGNAVPTEKHYTNPEVLCGIGTMLISMAAMMNMPLKAFDAIIGQLREDYIDYLKEKDVEG